MPTVDAMHDSAGAPPSEAVQPPARALSVLLIEDSEDDAFLLLRRFRLAGYEVRSRQVCSGNEMRAALTAQPWDLILCDHRMPGFDAMAALNLVQETGRDIPFIIVSGQIEEDKAIAAMRAGAHDYLNKNHLERLLPAVERELREAENRNSRRAAEETLRENEARLRSLASNTPGLIFQMVRSPDGGLLFPFASDACEMLLGVSADKLASQPDGFTRRVLSEDRESFLQALGRAGEAGARINWEGRVCTPRGGVKWINLRASARLLAGGSMAWEGVMWNITQSKQAETELRESQRQLAELSNHLQHVKEEERERIARDVHDVLGGHLVAMKFEIAMLANKLDAPPETLAQRAAALGRLVDEGIETVGRVTRELRPGILRDFGLAAAIEGQAEDFTQRTGIPCEILCADHDIELAESASIALFRIFQEALTNISKHAGADRVEVRLTEEGDDVILDIADNGCGIAADDLNKPRSFGLRGIRERLTSLGGSFAHDTSRPAGARLIARLPVHAGMDIRTEET
ncbi:MAG: response regulator [Rhodocyclaceae bacterium]|nr:response regulator [Rhodocyclaceae bacterium]